MEVVNFLPLLPLTQVATSGQKKGPQGLQVLRTRCKYNYILYYIYIYLYGKGLLASKCLEGGDNFDDPLSCLVDIGRQQSLSMLERRTVSALSIGTFNFYSDFIHPSIHPSSEKLE
jgi:hypothetical protein